MGKDGDVRHKRPPIMFMSPPKYVQGPYVIDDFHVYVGDLGTRATVICDKVVWGLSCRAGGLALDRFLFSGQASIGQVERALASDRDHKSDVIVGMGGGISA